MKFLKFLFLSFICISPSLHAQPPGFEDLVILYADGKYDKCILKAEKYTEKEDTKREPVPYIYMSMSLFQISKDQSWVEKNEEFAKAFKDALKYAAKFSKSDKDNAYASEYKEYLDELLNAVIEESQFFVMEEKYSKAVGNYKKVCEIFPNSAGGWLYKGVMDWRNRVKADAKIAWENAEKLIDTVVFEELTDAHKRLLKMAILEYAILQIELKQDAKAREMLDKGYIWFENDEQFKEKYDEIVNG